MPTPLVGMLLFIASEVMFFGGLFADLLQRPRHRTPACGGRRRRRTSSRPGRWPPITIILIASSFTMQFGVWAIRRGDQRRAPPLGSR